MKRMLKAAITSWPWTVFWLGSFTVFALALAWYLWHHPGGCITDC